MDKVAETMMRRKRMLVLEETVSKPDVPSESGSDSERGPKRPESSASRTFRGTARMISKVNMVTKSKGFNPDEFQPISKTLLYQLLRPLFIVMSMNGVFFYKKKELYYSGLLMRLFGPKRWEILQIYCVFISVLLLVNSLRSLFSFSPTDGFTHVLFFKMLWVLRWYHAASTAWFFTNMCWPRKKGSLADFFFKMQRICYPDRIIPYEQALKTAVRPVVILFIIYVAVNVAIPTYAFFGRGAGEEIFNALLAPYWLFPVGMQYDYIWKGVVILIIFLSTSLMSLTMIFYFVMCYILFKEMEYFGRTFQMKIRSDGQFTDNLEKFRIMHQKRCKLVEEADNLFKKYIANHYLVTVVLVCLLLFNIVYMEKDDQFLLLVASAYLLFVSFEMLFVSLAATAVNTQMLFVSLAATAVNTQSHAPQVIIHSIKACVETPEDQLVMNMFMNRLTGTEIGMTAWDMFVINKAAILNLLGFILTYFFLMVQLKTPVLGEIKCLCRFFTEDSVFVHQHHFVMDISA